MSDILDIDTSDDELMNILVPDVPNQVENAKKTTKFRTKEREKFLDRRHKLRHIMKWRSCYFENNPYEYEKYRECVKRFKEHPKSFQFKKRFRLHMDEDFHEGMKKISKHLQDKELKKAIYAEESDSGIHESTCSKSQVKCQDPVKLIINYEREIERATKKIDQNFAVYLHFPKCYPNIEEEKEKFTKHVIKNKQNLSGNETNDEFQKYWVERIKFLRKKAIDDEKQEIRKHWHDLEPRYEGLDEEMETLLVSDDDDDEECMIIEEPVEKIELC